MTKEEKMMGCLQVSLMPIVDKKNKEIDVKTVANNDGLQ